MLGQRALFTEEDKLRFIDGVELFLSHLAINRNLSMQTVRAYQADLNGFIKWLDSVPVEKHPLIGLPGLYITSLMQKGLARSTLSRKLSSLKTYFKYLMKEGYFSGDALPLKFHRPKMLKRLPEFLNVDDIMRLIAFTKSLVVTPEAASLTGNPKNDVALLPLRNLAIVETLFSSGIRVSELAQLTFEQVDWVEGELRILGKGARERVAFISRDALNALIRYKSIWSKISGKTHTPKSVLFLNYDGGPLDVRSIRRVLNMLAEKADLGRKVHPHLFRHSFATHLLNNGVDLRVVQELLGHVSIRSTQIYTHLSTERLKKAYLKAHPRAQQR